MKWTANRFWTRWMGRTGAVALLLAGAASCNVDPEDPLPYDVYLIYRLLNGPLVDEPKSIFVTSATYNGNLGGVSGADAKCAADAQAAGRTYKALIVDGTNRIACTSANCATSGASEHVDWVLIANQEYRRLGLTTVLGTTTDRGVFLAPLAAAFSDTAGWTWWTGFNPDYTDSGDAEQCSNWTSTIPVGIFGAASVSGTGAWANAFGSAGISGDPCSDNAKRIVCIEQ